MVSTTLKVVNNWQVIKEETIDDNFLIHKKKKGNQKKKKGNKTSHFLKSREALVQDEKKKINVKFWVTTLLGWKLCCTNNEEKQGYANS